ncbi:MAG TPA: hypothetical protein VIM77_05205 [Mucilaginibacter sp.]
MVIALHAYRPIKQLCRYYSNSANGFRLLNPETVAFISGIFGGITFEFHHDWCRVKTGRLQTCFDLAGDFSADALISFLTRHNIIRVNDLEG